MSDDYAFPVGPYAADYAVCQEVALDCVAGWFNAQRTGKGESFDIAQYEIMLRNSQYQSEWFTDRVERPPAGVPDDYALSLRAPTKDNKLIAFGIGGAATWKRCIEFFGLPYGSEEFPENQSIYFKTSPGGAKIREIALKWCAEREGQARPAWTGQWPLSTCHRYER